MTTKPKRQKSALAVPQPAPDGFAEIVALIATSQQSAYRAVNTALIDLYWQVGEYISRKIEAAEWGSGTVENLARFIAHTRPGIRGFTRSNLFRMRQFYETYRAASIVAAVPRQLKAGKRVPPSPLADKVAAAPRHLGPVETGASPNVSALLTQLSWTHHLIILGQSKRPEEREFYVRMAAKERWSSRQLERQFSAALFERVVLSPPKVSAAVRQMHPEAVDVFRDAYNIEFLGLPREHTENDLHHALLIRMKDFLLELGRDFCFIGSEFPVQVGTRDFALDLLFFHRGLNCLVAFELKVQRFEPEHLGKLTFYLEALDRDVRKPHEQPSIGVLLCASKEDKVVEYALSRTLSPALIAEYQTALPDKRLLQAKLQEFYMQDAREGEAE